MSDPHPADPDAALALLADRPLVVLGGAGMSTDSGIPDYRGPGSRGARPPGVEKETGGSRGARPPGVEKETGGSRGARPPGVMTYQEFVASPGNQQRYWARSHLGWGRMRHAEPNPGHRALAALDPELLITQNVDGLHEAAGSARMVALHGRIADVVCLGCREITSRAVLHGRLEAANPGFAAAHAGALMRPDGDVELDDTAGFVVPGCSSCGGVLKPDVVFFGENVPRERVERCYAAVDALVGTGGALLVVGSSLTVMSGLRFVRRAAKAATPVVIVNRGATRGDELATYKLDTGVSDFLESLMTTRLSGAA